MVSDAQSACPRYEAYIPALRITADVVRGEDFDRLANAIRKALANLSPETTAYEVLSAAFEETGGTR